LLVISESLPLNYDFSLSQAQFIKGKKKKSRREKNIGTEGAGERRGRKGDV
jgi:hypothetical protein